MVCNAANYNLIQPMTLPLKLVELNHSVSLFLGLRRNLAFVPSIAPKGTFGVYILVAGSVLVLSCLRQ
jgi:hypothetical protein